MITVYNKDVNSLNDSSATVQKPKDTQFMMLRNIEQGEEAPTRKLFALVHSFTQFLKSD